MKNPFNRSILKILACLFVVSVVCLIGFAAVNETEIDQKRKQQLRHFFELDMRKAEKRIGRKITVEEREKAWQAYLDGDRKKREKFAAYMKSQNVDLNMKGKVVDQYAVPVPGARLEFEIVTSSLTQRRARVFVATDENGLFTLTKKNGRCISIINITPPEGYDYLRSQQVSLSFWPDPDTRIEPEASLAGGLEYIGPNSENFNGRYYYDSQKHVVPFRLWKRVNAKPERLVKGSFNGKVYVGDGWYVVNFFRLVGFDNFSKVADPEANIDGDILFKVDFSEDKQNVILTVAPVKGGLIENPQLNLNAPESGYEPTKTFKFPAVSRKQIPHTWIITKSRGDRIYARMMLSYSRHLSSEKKNYLVISGDFLANPMGSRNLEPWGARYSGTNRLAKRDWKQKGFDDFKNKLEENQAEQMAQLESIYLCQIEDGGEYYKGCLGANQTFYKYIGTGNTQIHNSIPIVAKPRYTIDIEPQNTFTYISGLSKGKGGGTYAGFVFEESKLVLYFSEARFYQLKKRSDYLPIPYVNSKELVHDKYEVVEMIKPEPLQSD